MLQAWRNSDYHGLINTVKVHVKFGRLFAGVKRVWHIAIATRTDHFNYLLQGEKKEHQENGRYTCISYFYRLLFDFEYWKELYPENLQRYMVQSIHYMWTSPVLTRSYFTKTHRCIVWDSHSKMFITMQKLYTGKV